MANQEKLAETTVIVKPKSRLTKKTPAEIQTIQEKLLFAPLPTRYLYRQNFKDQFSRLYQLLIPFVINPLLHTFPITQST